MPAGHLVARLQLALHRHEHLDHLHHARRQFVTALQLFDLAVETLLQLLDRGVELTLHGLDLGHHRVVLHADLAPGCGSELLQQQVVDHRAGLDGLEAAAGLAIQQPLAQPAEEGPLLDLLLVVAVLGQPLDLGPVDGRRALVLVHAAAVEDPHIDDGAGHAGRQPQRGVAHVARLFAEDRAEQLLLRRHRRFTLGRHLAHQDVARLHFGTNIDDAGLIEVPQRFLADIRDVAGDFLLAQLGIPGHHLELFDVNGGEDVVARDALRDQDAVLKVVAVPGHERDEHVASQRQLAQLGARTVGDDLAGADHVAHFDQRPLVDAGALVGTHELPQPVNVHAARRAVIARRPHHDARTVDLVHHAIATRHNRRA